MLMSLARAKDWVMELMAANPGSRKAA